MQKEQWPAFLSRDDAAFAIDIAHRQQVDALQKHCLQEADKYKAAYDAACGEYAKAGSDGVKQAARDRATQAQASEEHSREKSRLVEDIPAPPVRSTFSLSA